MRVDVSPSFLMILAFANIIIRPDVIPDFYICLYSLSDVKMDKMTSHPHATQPFIHLPIVGSANTASVLDVHIVGRYIMSKMGVNSGAVYTYFIDISDWKTCQTVSVRIIPCPAGIQLS